MHSIAFKYSPKSFDNIWIKNSERIIDLNLRNEDNFYVPAPKIDLFKKMPIYSLPLEWNNCGILKFYENRFTFKHALREQLYTELQIN